MRPSHPHCQAEAHVSRDIYLMTVTNSHTDSPVVLSGILWPGTHGEQVAGHSVTGRRAWVQHLDPEVAVTHNLRDCQ